MILWVLLLFLWWRVTNTWDSIDNPLTIIASFVETAIIFENALECCYNALMKSWELGSKVKHLQQYIGIGIECSAIYTCKSQFKWNIFRDVHCHYFYILLCRKCQTLKSFKYRYKQVLFTSSSAHFPLSLEVESKFTSEFVKICAYWQNFKYIRRLP